MRLSLPLGSNTGCLVLVVGCAKSGKTEELRSVASVCNALRVRFQLFAYPGSATLSEKRTFELTDDAGPWTSKAQLARSPSEIESLIRPDSRVIMFDDLHLFDNAILSLFERLVHKGSIVVAAGRDMTYEGEPVPSVGNALALADQVLKFYALCDVCGKDASFTVRMENNREVPSCRRCRNSSTVLA